MEATDILKTASAILAQNYGGLNLPLFYCCLFLFCLSVANVRRQESFPSLAVYTYGGSTLASFLLQVPPFIYYNLYALPTLILARWVLNVIPSEVLANTQVQWIIRLGAESCRAGIATTWFANAEKVLGSRKLLECCMIGAIAGSFGSVLGSLSWKPFFHSLTIGALFVAMVIYGFALDRSNIEQQNVARAFIVCWMLFMQYLYPSLRRWLSSFFTTTTATVTTTTHPTKQKKRSKRQD